MSTSFSFTFVINGSFIDFFREVYESYHQAKEQHNQQELLQHSLLQQQEQRLNSTRQEQQIAAAPFQIYQSPPHESNANAIAFQIYQSPAVQENSVHNKSNVPLPSSGGDGSNSFLDDLWKASVSGNTEEEIFIPKTNVSKFVIHEASNLGIQPQIQPKGSAMKTPFR